MEVWHGRPKLHTITAALVALFLFASVGRIHAQTAATPHAAPVAASAFGSPPSGEIPILYNDHTVYTKPDVLRKSRVLAAFVKDHQIYVPLRSMFEQMGATVTASPDGKTFTATKPGTTVSVALGSTEVTINGEARPLDVPPILYKGIVMVPVRVISEALGAYVLWVGDRNPRLVVIRYIPATPAPVPSVAPTIEPTTPPTPAPLPVATPESYTAFVQAAMSHPKIYNEFSAGDHCNQSYLVAAALLFKNSPFALKADFRQDAFVSTDNLTFLGNHYTRFNTIDGGFAFTPVFTGKQTAFDARLLYQIAAPKIYVGAGYLQTTTNYGYPKLTGFGVGVEKLPDLNKGLNLFGSAFYYPNATGTYTINSASSPNAGVTYRQQFQITKYDVGAALVLGRSPIYLYGGFAGLRYTVKQNAPVGQTHDGPYIGLGAKL